MILHTKVSILKVSTFSKLEVGSFASFCPLRIKLFQKETEKSWKDGIFHPTSSLKRNHIKNLGLKIAQKIRKTAKKLVD